MLWQDGTGAWVLSVYTFDFGKNPSERTLIHQLKMVLASPNAPTGEGRYGVTGRQFVYEHNGRELQYWCGFRRE